MKWQGQQFVQYEGRSLDPLTANAIVTTSDSTYVFTVSLNHTLRAWNLATGRLVLTKDLLNKQRLPQDMSSVMLNPAENSFIRIYKPPILDAKCLCYLLTFSPHDEGQFKLWSVGGGLTEPLTITDEFPDVKLKPPDPDPTGATIWTLAGFEVVSADAGRATELWVLWRNHTAYKLYSLHFSFRTIEDSWAKDWVSTTSETWQEADLPITTASDVADPSELWLDFFFHPGRLNEPVLETSLSIYKRALRLEDSSTKMDSLQERICATIGATVSLRKYADGSMDYDRFRADTDAQWRQYWRIADKLNQKRREPLSLAYDTFTNLPWIAMTDACTAIRECSDIELLYHNDTPSLLENDLSSISRWTHRGMASDKLREHAEPASMLITCATDFRNKFSPELYLNCETALRAELSSEPVYTAQIRLATFYDSCDFYNLISSDESNQVEDQIKAYGADQLLDNATFFAIIDSILPGWNSNDSKLQSTLFGRGLMVQGAQEMIHLTREILLNLLVLVVFVDGEFGQDEPLSATFEAQELFSFLIHDLKQHDMMIWLASNVREPPRIRQKAEEGDPRADAASNGSDTARNVSTVLENLFATDIKPQPTVEYPESYLLTQGIRDIISWTNGSEETTPEDSLVYIQCDLLANNNIDLASSFMRFQPSTAWSTYVKGRLCLATSDYDPAANHFRRAAYRMCKWTSFLQGSQN